MSGRRIALLIAAAFTCVIVCLIVVIRERGFSASEKPSWLEARMARRARKIMTPANAKNLYNPEPVTAETLAAGRAHFADHCATCHGLDGRGKTEIGQNMYPPAPDMTDAETQRLSEGELFYIIQNGIRFTGMPAWRSEHTAKQTWELVAFIRHLPQLSAEEIELMRKGSAEGEESHGHEHAHTHGSNAQMHEH